MSWTETPITGSPYTVYAIGLLYNMLLTMVQTEMSSDIYSKADTTRFERIPAIGFGIPVIEQANDMSQMDKINIDIPVVIQDGGANPMVTISLVEIYEQFKETVNSKLDSYIDSNDLDVDIWELDQFRSQPDPYDTEMRGLGGTISFRLSLSKKV